MSLITRCPACETLFRVVPDQLRISEGWVRCGQCDEIFDASLHLLTDAVPAPHAIAPPPPEQIREVDLELDLEVVVAAVEPRANTHPLTPITPAPTAVLEPVPPAPRLPVDEPDASFLRVKKPNAFWRRPLVRFALGSLMLLLLGLLAGQVVWQERDRLAASQPGLAPWLRGFCHAFNCALSPLRRIDALVIESSTFARLERDVYRLNFMLKNNAPSPLAVPALELTMTDASDQPVLRRVLLPAELGATQDALAAGAEWPVSVAFTVRTEAQAPAVAGYRLLIFYP